MIEVWIVIAFAVAILGYGFSGMIGGYKPEKQMATVKGDVRKLGEFLKSRGVDLAEVEQAHAAKSRGQHDGYDVRTKPQQCTGFIQCSNNTMRNPDWSDRCRKTTTHPSGLCSQHRRQVR